MKTLKNMLEQIAESPRLHLSVGGKFRPFYAIWLNWRAGYYV